MSFTHFQVNSMSLCSNYQFGIICKPMSGVGIIPYCFPRNYFFMTFVCFSMKDLVVVIQWLSHVQLFATPWTAACQDSLSFTISQSLLKLLYIESVMLSNISSSVVPFSSCPQSLPASGSLPMHQLFA